MFCSNCGNKCDDNAIICVKCGCSLNSQKQIEKPPCPPTYLTSSILVPLLCLPCGIVALIYSCGVQSAWAAGNYEVALQKSKSAKMWVSISYVVGFVLLAFYFFLKSSEL